MSLVTDSLSSQSIITTTDSLSWWWRETEVCSARSPTFPGRSATTTLHFRSGRAKFSRSLAFFYFGWVGADRDLPRDLGLVFLNRTRGAGEGGGEGRGRCRQPPREASPCAEPQCRRTRREKRSTVARTTDRRRVARTRVPNEKKKPEASPLQHRPFPRRDVKRSSRRAHRAAPAARGDGQESISHDVRTTRPVTAAHRSTVGATPWLEARPCARRYVVKLSTKRTLAFFGVRR